MARIVTVLRSGGEYRTEHVMRLKRMCEQYAPGVDFLCLTDMDVDCDTQPLTHNWPGWWSKLNLCSPDIEGDLLFMDLDTTIIGDISHMMDHDGPLMLRDFYFPDRLASGVMFLPEIDRPAVWHDFASAPDKWMRAAGKRGDGWVYEELLPYAETFQILHPGHIVSYKAHIRVSQGDREHGDGTVPDGARIVCYHGKPRPWQINEAQLFGS